MIPLHFGSRERLLFGSYTPASGSLKRRGVVICNPWGAEALRAHRSLRLLADRLAAEGLEVLRFDYFGTGDSWGEGGQVSLSGCTEDTLCALEEIKAVAAVERVDLVGLRLGAYVAADAAARARDVSRVVLWDPVASGPDYLSELLQGSVRTSGTEGYEVGGFPLPVALREELRLATLDGLPGGSTHVLLAVSQSCNGSVRGRIQGAEVASRIVDAPPCWVEERDFGSGAVPVELLRVVTEWLT
jgi:pimeloyl-ACP methyl ester carboxylesterase